MSPTERQAPGDGACVTAAEGGEEGGVPLGCNEALRGSALDPAPHPQTAAPTATARAKQRRGALTRTSCRAATGNSTGSPPQLPNSPSGRGRPLLPASPGPDSRRQFLGRGLLEAAIPLRWQAFDIVPVASPRRLRPLLA